MLCQLWGGNGEGPRGMATGRDLLGPYSQGFCVFAYMQADALSHLWRLRLLRHWQHVGWIHLQSNNCMDYFEIKPRSSSRHPPKRGPTSSLRRVYMCQYSTWYLQYCFRPFRPWTFNLEHIFHYSFYFLLICDGSWKISEMVSSEIEIDF